jgi:hypothetical protein
MRIKGFGAPEKAMFYATRVTQVYKIATRWLHCRFAPGGLSELAVQCLRLTQCTGRSALPLWQCDFRKSAALTGHPAVCHLKSLMALHKNLKPVQNRNLIS